MEMTTGHQGRMQTSPLYAGVQEEDVEDAGTTISSSHKVSNLANVFWQSRRNPILATLLAIFTVMIVLVIENGILISHLSVSVTCPSSSGGDSDHLLFVLASRQFAPKSQKSSLFSLTIDDSTGHSYAILPLSLLDGSTPLLLIEQIVKGVGLQALFWDPGNILGQDIVYFTFSPDHLSVLMLVKQLTYRGNPTLIQRSFADGLIATFPVITRDKHSVAIDITDFTLREARLVSSSSLPAALRSYLGTNAIYTFDKTRSFVDINPTNNATSTRVYFDSWLTYNYDNSAMSPPSYVSEVLPSSQAITITVRRSFIYLPTNTSAFYKPRLYHPKSGFNSISYMNEATSVLNNRQQLLLTRHNTQQDTPSIIYYIDPLIPEPFLTAVVEGVSWWDEAFVYAGYPRGTFTAQVAPNGFDPYDLFWTNPQGVVQRVHFVQWIDRDTRSYSVGLRVIDPRTGEILRGHVRIEGLRMRQDALLAEALLSPYSQDGSLSSNDREIIMDAVKQRARHLGAHEVGHTLGLSHNFAGSAFIGNNYASVMDYPPPIVKLQRQDGIDRLVLNNGSYSNGIGLFDKFAIQYGYTRLATQINNNDIASEWPELMHFLHEAELEGYVYVTDQDSSSYGADWRDTKWDSLPNAIQALNDSLIVRRIALKHMGLHSLHNFSAVSDLLTLIPVVHLWHRYEVESVAKLIGGRSVQYPLRGDGSDITAIAEPVSGSVQLQAVNMLLEAVMPWNIAIPAELRRITSGPMAFGYISGKTMLLFILLLFDTMCIDCSYRRYW